MYEVFDGLKEKNKNSYIYSYGFVCSLRENSSNLVGNVESIILDKLIETPQLFF